MKEKLTLSNICEGRAEHMFQREIKKTLENIADPATTATREREVIIKFKFKPSKDRTRVDVIAQAQTKLAPISDIEGQSIELDYSKRGPFRPEAYTSVPDVGGAEDENKVINLGDL